MSPITLTFIPIVHKTQIIRKIKIYSIDLAMNLYMIVIYNALQIYANQTNLIITLTKMAPITYQISGHNSLKNSFQSNSGSNSLDLSVSPSSRLLVSRERHSAKCKCFRKLQAPRKVLVPMQTCITGNAWPVLLSCTVRIRAGASVNIFLVVEIPMPWFGALLVFKQLGKFLECKILKV